MITADMFLTAFFDGAITGLTLAAQSLATAIADNPVLGLILGAALVGGLVLRPTPKRRYRR